MKHILQKLGIPGIVLVICALPAALTAQAFTTTTVQGTVYLANGAPGSGTLQLSWPAFTTAANQAVAAGRMMVNIASDGFLSVNLAPNSGAIPAGLYYTAVYHLSDGTTSTEYWLIPAAAQATIAQVRATVMPAAQAVQAVSKTYVDQAVQLAAQSQLTASGGNLTGPLYLNGDPSSPTQAATKHYVDNQFSQALSVNGGTANGPLTATQLGAVFQADQFPGSDFGARLQACINALNATYGGTCDARNFTGTLGMAANLIISKANVTVNLPCATISTTGQIVATAGTRNVTLHGCASRGTTAASGNQGGTVILYTGNAAAVQAGDAAYSSDTLGFHLDNVVLNTTNSLSATAQAIAILRTQEIHLEALYLLGNANQTGITLDGTGNYTGGTLTDLEIGGFQTAINGIGHQVPNPATTDWVNATTFVRLHIDCPTTNGNPVAGTAGINLLQGDGNMFSGGDVEGCATALHLGPNAQNNTIVGLRNENSTYQVVAETGSAYNNWMTGGTMFTGRLTDNGTRNSFLDTFHRSFNGINGDWYGSQQDATLMNHFRLGIGNGNERGLQNRYQTDYGYRWTTGLTDATAGEQFYQVLDELNNVNRLSIGQYNNGQGSTNNQTVINAAGTGAIVLNGSNNAGSGGVVFGSGGPASTTVATINNTGNAQFNGTLQVGGTTTFTGSPSVKNQADAEIDYFLQAGAAAPQKESVIYKDWNGNSQWYLVKDTSNNWALNSAVGGIDSFKAYQSTNSGDTYIDAANNTGAVRVNYEPGSGSAFNVYGGGSSTLYASFNGTTGIKFPGLASSSGKNCVQIDNSGYLSNTGSACAGSAVAAGTTGQIAYYPGNGSSLSGMATVPISSGGTGASSAAAALTGLGGLALTGGTLNGPLTLSGDPTTNLQAATKQYVDQTAASAVQDPKCKADGNGNLNCGNITASGSVALGTDLPSGHQAASANAAVTTYSVLAFGAKADFGPTGQNTWDLASQSAGSNTITDGTCHWTSGDVGKWIFWYNIGSVTPVYSSAPYSAQITAVTDSCHIVVNRAAVNSIAGAKLSYGTDNTPFIAACQEYAATHGGGQCFFPSMGAYLLASTPYYSWMGASDNGDYGQPGGGSGAAGTATMSGSCSLASPCTVTGATVTSAGNGLYTPNSQIGVAFTGGCTGTYHCGGAAGYATIDSTGHVSGVTMLGNGYGYTGTPTVSFGTIGGDGAAATVTVSGGSINSTTITNPGAGYSASGSMPVYGIGGGCTPLSNNSYYHSASITATGGATTNSSGKVTSITWGNAGTGCTSAPTVIFVQSCNQGQQCTNQPPVRQHKQYAAIYPVTGVSLVGPQGSQAAIITPWDGYVVDNNQPAVIGGPISYMDIRNLWLSGFIGISGTNNVHHTTWDNIGTYGAIGIMNAAMDLGSKITNVRLSDWAPFINGGAWNGRLDYPSINGGFNNAQLLDSWELDSFPYQSNTYAASLDTWFDSSFWRSDLSSASTDFMTASGTCPTPLTPAPRQTDHSMNDPHTGNEMCFRGIYGTEISDLHRYGNGSQAHFISNIIAKTGTRYLYYGDLGGGSLINATCCEGGAQLTTDPYRQPGLTYQESGVTYRGGNGSYLKDVSFAMGGHVSQPAWNMAGLTFGGSDGEPVNDEIVNVTSPSSDWSTSAMNYRHNFTVYNSIGIGSMYSSAGDNGGSISAFYNGLRVTNNAGANLLDIFDTSSKFYYPLIVPGVTVNGPSAVNGALSAQSAAVNGGTAMTGNQGNGTLVQHSTGTATSGKPAAFDAGGNTVNATAANIVSLFASCSGTQYLGADGACHNSSSGASLPPCTFNNGCIEQIQINGQGGEAGIGGPLNTVSGTSAAGIAPTGSSPMVVRYTSSATSGYSAGVAGAGSLYWGRRWPLLTFGISYTAGTDYSSNERINYGLLASSCNVGTFTASDNPACLYVTIQFSTTRGDSTYKCVSDNGNSSYQVVTDTGVSPATGYTVMQVGIDGTGAYCTINGGPKVYAGSPGYDLAYSDVFLNTTLTNAATHFQWSGVYGYSTNGNF